MNMLYGDHTRTRSGGDLMERLAAQGRSSYEEREAADIVRKIAGALSHCHSVSLSSRLEKCPNAPSVNNQSGSFLYYCCSFRFVWFCARRVPPPRDDTGGGGVWGEQNTVFYEGQRTPFGPEDFPKSISRYLHFLQENPRYRNRWRWQAENSNSCGISKAEVSVF